MVVFILGAFTQLKICTLFTITVARVSMHYFEEFIKTVESIYPSCMDGSVPDTSVAHPHNSRKGNEVKDCGKDACFPKIICSFGFTDAKC